MEFGAELLPNKESEKLMTLGEKFENNGFDQIWVADHFNNRNIYCVLSNLASRTKEIQIGPGVTNPYVIHPAESASGIQTINEISGGRAIFGIGAGDSYTLSRLGLSWDKPLKRTEESIKIIKNLLTGKEINHKGEFFNLNSAKLDFGKKLPKIPIYLGAQGPQMLKLGGKIADGVLINASNLKEINLAIKKINESNYGGETKKVAHTLFSIGENRKEAREKAREVIAFILDSIPKEVLKRNDVSRKTTKKVSEGIKKGNTSEAINQVTENMIDTFSIAGNLEDCTKKINQLKEIGLDGLVVGSPIGPNKSKAIKLLGENILDSKN